MQNQPAITIKNIITTDDGINIDFIYIDKKEHLSLKTQIEKLQDRQHQHNILFSSTQQ